MDFQNFINKNNDYIQQLKNLNIIVKKYSHINLIIVKYKKNYNYDFLNFPWIKYCKGTIINTKTNKIICLPPLISTTINNDIPFITNLMLGPHNDNDNDNENYQTLIDGTMINVFFHNNEWFISTRSFIGAKNKFSNDISFKSMWDECFHHYDELNKKHSYSFVIQHINNRNITLHTINKVTLVEEYSFESISNHDPLFMAPAGFSPINNITNINLNYHNYSFDVIKSLNKNDVTHFNDTSAYPKNFQIKGYTIKNKNIRYNCINPYFNIASQLKGNFNNKLHLFLSLTNNNKLFEYIQFFPEDKQIFHEYKNKITFIINDIYKKYVNMFIHKNINNKNIPYQIKPIVYNIHKKYLNTQNNTSFNSVKKYFYKLPHNKITFIYNYY
jgi:hypothetical protein